jgi:hypothetical protein
MISTEARRLQALDAKRQRLAAQLASTDLISSGSVVQRFMPCGKPNCRCHADPPQLHGPYWQWTTAVGGKTVTRRLSERQAHLYQQWIANRRRLQGLVAEMEKVSRQAAEILLADPESSPQPASARLPTGSPRARPSRRVTQQLAQALLDVTELVEPLTEAAQEWLDASDSGDRQTVAEARQALQTALDESPTLAEGLIRLAQLIASGSRSRPTFSGPSSEG